MGLYERRIVKCNQTLTPLCYRLSRQKRTPKASGRKLIENNSDILKAETRRGLLSPKLFTMCLTM